MDACGRTALGDELRDLRARRRRAAAGDDGVHVHAIACRGGDRPEEQIVALDRVDARDHSREQRVAGQAELGTERGARRRVRPEALGVEAVRHDLGAARVEAERRVLRGAAVRVVDDALDLVRKRDVAADGEPRRRSLVRACGARQ